MRWVHYSDSILRPTKSEMVAITQIHNGMRYREKRICIHILLLNIFVVTFSTIAHGPEIHKIYAKLRNASLICA